VSYQTQRYLAIAVAVLLTGCAVILAANPADFGLTPVAARWLGVVVAMLGVAQGFLPSVRGMSQDPGFLANRIMDLSPADRTALVAEVEHRRVLESIGSEDAR
jgi:hypothetical protein